MKYKKIRKFFRDPILFIRDAILKHRPLIFNEVNVSINNEKIIVEQLNYLESKIENFLPVDVVYTWVDDTDPIWREKKNNVLKDYPRDNLALYSDDHARFANNNELQYSIASVKKFMPWVRNIFIVTDKQCPKWLENEPNIKIIDHEKIIDNKYLPTFNSHVIEANLYRIPDLSEHFIYFNDDIFVARPLNKSHFFQSNGIASLFLSDKSLNIMNSKGMATPTLNASRRGVELLKRDYNISIDTPIVHTYVPLRRSILEELSKQYAALIEEFMSNKFRSNEDLNIPTFLAPWVTYVKGLAVPKIDICYYFNIRSRTATAYWQQLLNSGEAFKPHSFCANDFTTLNDKKIHVNLDFLLNQYFK